MRLGSFALGVCTVLATAAPSVHADSLDDKLDHAGKVRIGEKLSAVKREAGDAKGASTSDDASGCGQVQSRLLPKGVSMMVEDGIVVRFEIVEGTARDPFGVGIGDNEASALKKLPRGIVVGPGFSGDKHDHVLTWRAARGNLALRVETTAGKVTMLYWGSWKAVQYVEGCA